MYVMWRLQYDLLAIGMNGSSWATALKVIMVSAVGLVVYYTEYIMFYCAWK